MTARPIIHDLEEALQSGIQTTERDSIGCKGGRLLSQASCAVPLLPSAFIGYDELGMERLSGPDPLFLQENEENWSMGISFEEASSSPTPIEERQPPNEAFVFDSIQKIEDEPEPFDYASIADELEEEVQAFPQTSLTPQALALIDEILADEELDDVCLGQSEEEEEDSLSDEALALIEDILEGEEWEDIRNIKIPKMTEEITFAMLPKISPQEDFPWDEVQIDAEAELTSAELSWLKELGL